jgi:hypothetical protein
VWIIESIISSIHGVHHSRNHVKLLISQHQLSARSCCSSTRNGAQEGGHLAETGKSLCLDYTTQQLSYRQAICSLREAEDQEEFFGVLKVWWCSTCASCWGFVACNQQLVCCQHTFGYDASDPQTAVALCRLPEQPEDGFTSLAEAAAALAPTASRSPEELLAEFEQQVRSLLCQHAVTVRVAVCPLN